MPLFQASVLNSHLRLQDPQQLEEAYHKFTSYFHNPVIQENIRNSKEEQFQATFLNELFVRVLGYTLNPNPEYNLTTEFKNESNNRKADGAILLNGVAVGVIELKGTNTKDLESIRRQAFDYKANQKGCVYVITSNFEKLRFYVNDATEFEEFNLFELSREEFALLQLCLGKENLLSNLPLKIKEASLVVEEEITKKFYSDYSIFKRELYQNLVKRNLQRLRAGQLIPVEMESASGEEEDGEQEKAIKLNLFKKSQKLIDRFLFVFFAEDRNLLPPNSAMQILDKWKADMDFGDERPLYDLFRQYFGFLHTGRPSTASRAEIYAYNGGLFKPDEILDLVEIDSEMLYKHTRKLASYDFESQVDVNILGHIFENSLNEIEGMTSEIEGTDFEKQKSKRKKDGVFYTPKYITKYIVENTVGRLCTEKKQELGFREEEYYEGRNKKHKKTILNLVKVLDDYRDWLLQLSICDPACGSGAFLNQALDFLIKEHRYIDELKTKLLGGSLVLSDIENTILENNIYGVDINEESVEIAKLSLWLRTAQPRRKLNDLSSNIKCGNSLIDDPAVAGEKAFKWEEEFPEIFAKGGFDVVIGNPPYGIFLGKEEEKYYKVNFPLTSYKINLYILFIERMFQIFEKGLIQFIVPKSLLFNSYFQTIRKKLLLDSRIHEIFMLSEKVFDDAEVGGSLLIKFEILNSENGSNRIKLISSETFQDFENNNCLVNDINQNFFLSIPHFEISPVSKGSQKIIEKLHSLKPLKEYYNLKNGLNPGNIKAILISDLKLSDKHKPIIWGREFNRYSIFWGGQYINYDPNIGEKLTLEDIKSKEGMKKQKRIDFALRNPEMFEIPKVIVRKTGDRFIAAKDDANFYFDTLVHGIYEKEHEYSLDFLLAVLNSNPATFFYRLLHDIKGKVFAKISLDKLGAFPIPEPSLVERNKLEILSKKMTSIHIGRNYLIQKFINYLISSLGVTQTNKKLENWWTLNFSGFLKEVKTSFKEKKIEGLSKKDEMEWMELFEENKKKALELQQQIDQIDREIDQMVYELYGLTEEEIKIVEGSSTNQ